MFFCGLCGSKKTEDNQDNFEITAEMRKELEARGYNENGDQENHGFDPDHYQVQGLKVEKITPARAAPSPNTVVDSVERSEERSIASPSPSNF